VHHVDTKRTSCRYGSEVPVIEPSDFINMLTIAAVPDNATESAENQEEAETDTGVKKN